MKILASPVKRINRKDPSGLRSTEDARAEIAKHDLDETLARIAQRAQGTTDPLLLQRIIKDELTRYQQLATQRHVIWIIDTMYRARLRADMLVKTLGVK